MGVPVVVIHACWSFDSHCWWFSLLLGSQCCLLGAGCHLPLVVFFVCGDRWGGWHILGGPGCLRWWGLCDVAVGNSLLLTLVMWACDHRVWLLGSCCGLWAAGDVCGGGVYMWAMWWQAIVEVVVVGWRRKMCHRLWCVWLLDQCLNACVHAHTHAQICSVHTIYVFVTSFIQIYSVQYRILQCPPQTL